VQIECRGWSVGFRVCRVHEIGGANWVSGSGCKV